MRFHPLKEAGFALTMGSLFVGIVAVVAVAIAAEVGLAAGEMIGLVKPSGYRG